MQTTMSHSSIRMSSGSPEKDLDTRTIEICQANALCPTRQLRGLDYCPVESTDSCPVYRFYQKYGGVQLEPLH